jgi:hypothetical protein
VTGGGLALATFHSHHHMLCSAQLSVLKSIFILHAKENGWPRQADIYIYPQSSPTTSRPAGLTLTTRPNSYSVSPDSDGESRRARAVQNRQAAAGLRRRRPSASTTMCAVCRGDERSAPCDVAWRTFFPPRTCMIRGRQEAVHRRRSPTSQVNGTSATASQPQASLAASAPRATRPAARGGCS